VIRRYGHLWETLISFENLYAAARKARRGKRRKTAVERFEFDLESSLVRLRESLWDRSYRPGPFHTFTITDPKPRLISAAPYRDRARSGNFSLAIGRPDADSVAAPA
jgi:RNA-directed DNA polymerase